MGVSGWVKVLKKSLRNSGNIHYPGWSVGPVTAGPRGASGTWNLSGFWSCAASLHQSNSLSKISIVSRENPRVSIVFSIRLQSMSPSAPTHLGRALASAVHPTRQKPPMRGGTWREGDAFHKESRWLKPHSLYIYIYPFGQSQRDKNMEHHEPSMKHERNVYENLT